MVDLRDVWDRVREETKKVVYLDRDEEIQKEVKTLKRV
tara:strand:+ start:364 stop:477 length:114 start_codon:yes stop_codon:yes gene_type:complete